MFWVFGVCIVCLGICLPLFLYYKKSLRLPLAVLRSVPEHLLKVVERSLLLQSKPAFHHG